MTLSSLEQQINTYKILDNTNKKRMFVLLARDLLNKKAPDIKSFGIDKNNFSVYYYQAKAKIKTSETFKHIKEVLSKQVKNTSPDIQLYDYINTVKEFRQSFGLRIKEKPSLLTKSEYDLHFKLLREELDEYFEACENGDKTEVFDALIDLGYVLFGAVLHHGMQNIYIDGFKEVHDSNMSKLENGKPVINGQNGVLDESRPLGKVLKGRDYFAPDLKNIINKDI